MSELNYQVLPTPSVSVAVVTAKTDGAITQIKVWLKTLTELVSPVTPITFINDNDLKPNILALAGVTDDTEDYFNLLTELDSYTEGRYFIYELRLSHTEN